jgi:predicted HTH transcriptional regulator
MVYDPFTYVRELTEGVDFELKRSSGRDGRGELPASFFETYSAMANTHGGTVVLGVAQLKSDDNKPEFEIVGIRDHERVLKALWDSLNDPNRVSANILQEKHVQVIPVGDDHSLISVAVPRATRTARPIYVGTNPLKGTYRRNFEGDYRCDPETVRRMIAEQVEDSRDSRVLENFDIDDLDAETVKAYRQQMRAVKSEHPWHQHEDTEFLRCLGAYGVDRQAGHKGVTQAGLLMFGKLRSILEAFPNYVVDYQERPASREDGRWLDRVTTDGTWSGNLFDFYRLVIKKLVSDLKVPFRLQGGTTRVDETGVHEALREALVNTLLHADYSGTVPLLVLKRPGLVGFRNPGSMRVPIHEAIRGGLSDCRNRNLQKMFQLAGLAEQAGSGVPKIYQNWKQQHWRSPDLWERTDPEQTVLTMHMSSLLPEEALGALDRRFGPSFRELPEVERLALATVEIEGTVTHSRLKAMADAHPSDLSKALAGLVRDGYLQSSRSGRATFYVFPGDSPEEDAPDLLGSSRFELFATLDPVTSSSSHKDGDSPHNALENSPHTTEVVQKVAGSKRAPRESVNTAILEVCRKDYRTLREIADQLRRAPETLGQHYVPHLIADGRLTLRYPESPNHPHQGYRTAQD